MLSLRFIDLNAELPLEMKRMSDWRYIVPYDYYVLYLNTENLPKKKKIALEDNNKTPIQK